MSSTAEVLHITAQPGILETTADESKTSFIPRTRAFWNCDQFAEEQIRHLVRQVFCPGWPRPARQVVISAVDQETDITGLCMQVTQALAQQITGNICVVEASLRTRGLENSFGRSTSDPVCGQLRRGSLRESSRQISEKLWQAPLSASTGEGKYGLSVPWLRDRLAQLRRDFEYTVLCAPPAVLSSQAALLGHLSDGVILVLEANSTRRMAARKAKDLLQAANARLLGTVLSERTFPIPEGIYRRL
ncbi:MAG: hypothetical protein LAN83_11875 [Acidobacteriia bacterium]|nr:hypothetical protein [Terriglobia bacterium]